MKFQKHKDSRLFVPDHIESSEDSLERILDANRQMSRRGLLRFGIAAVATGAGALLFGAGCKPKKHPFWIPPTGSGTGTGTGTDTSTSTGTGTGTGTGQPPVYYSVSGQITDFDANNLQALVELKQSGITKASQNCLADGTYNIASLVEGEYDVHVSNSGFTPHYAGKLIVNAVKEGEAKLSNINFELFTNDATFNAFFNEVCRSAQPYTQRWRPTSETGPIDAYIVTKNVYDNSDIPEAALQVAEAMFNTKIPQFTRGRVNSFNIQRVTSLPAKAPKSIWKYWDAGMSGYGSHSEDDGYGDDTAPYLSFGSIRIRGPPPFGVVYQIDEPHLYEYGQMLGARRDATVIPSGDSVFKDGGISLFDYTLNDLLLGKILYTRPAGNISPDNNPIDTPVNP